MIPSPIDTLRADTAQIALWLSDPCFQYNRELVRSEDTFWDWLLKLVGEWLNRLFDSQTAEVYTERFLMVVAVGFFLFIFWLVYRHRLRLFVRSSKEIMAYEVEEDTIYGVDFDLAIQQAFERSDYREAVRLLYLQTLKLLSDAGRIDWQLYKTPTQYLNECRLPAFRSLTNEFLRVRYGHFEASDLLFRQLKSLQAAICEERRVS
ncbi:hypothetical protein EVA_02877 [gut metagenome]|uniref:Protein-glutamine gamma-glutamyltransferase-like C-terminal domain-containing protein n=1 Tax=gut metagenome TaxID=749906 RepID=J9H562_9ZZZZ